MENEQQTAIIIKGKVHRLTTFPQNEPILCKDCSLFELCDRLEENLLCTLIGGPADIGCSSVTIKRYEPLKVIFSTNLMTNNLIKELWINHYSE